MSSIVIRKYCVFNVRICYRNPVLFKLEKNEERITISDYWTALNCIVSYLSIFLMIVYLETICSRFCHLAIIHKDAIKI